jgi:hypothetical protein
LSGSKLPPNPVWISEIAKISRGACLPAPLLTMKGTEQAPLFPPFGIPLTPNPLSILCPGRVIVVSGRGRREILFSPLFPLNPSVRGSDPIPALVPLSSKNKLKRRSIIMGTRKLQLNLYLPDNYRDTLQRMAAERMLKIPRRSATASRIAAEIICEYLNNLINKKSTNVE